MGCTGKRRDEPLLFNNGITHKPALPLCPRYSRRGARNGEGRAVVRLLSGFRVGRRLEG